MSFPIPYRSPVSNTSSQIPYTQGNKPYMNTLETILLVSDLISFSSQQITEANLKSRSNLTSSDSITLQITSDQISGIAKHTSKSAAQIAMATIYCNIDLKNKLLTNNILEYQEMKNIKAMLSDTERQPSTLQGIDSDPVSTSPQPSTSQETCPTPPTKRPKLHHHDTRELVSSSKSKLETTCSVEILAALIKYLHQNAKTPVHNPFQCPRGHQEKICQECAPIKALLSTCSNPESPVGQILALCCYISSPQPLVDSLLRNKSILHTFLLGRHLKNHQLVILIEESGIPKDIYSARYRSHLNLYHFYLTAENLVSAKEPSPLIHSLLQVWNKNVLIPTNPAPLITIQDRDLSIAYNESSLAFLIPKANRYTIRKKPIRGASYTEYIKGTITPNISRFIAKIAFTTICALLDDESSSDLFIHTPSGKVLDIQVVHQLMATILLSVRRWYFIAPASRASIHHLNQELTFNEPLKGILSDALDKFCEKNAIHLPGARIL